MSQSLNADHFVPQRFFLGWVAGVWVYSLYKGLGAGCRFDEG